jgi:hypothetical protein
VILRGSSTQDQKSLIAKISSSDYVFLIVRLLILILTAATAFALPPLDEARRILGSQKAAAREALTLEIWESGREAIPLMTKLSADEDPEVALRADFVLQRLRMGLKPGSPEELLKLAQAVDEAQHDFRASRLGELLEHPQGILAGLVFFDTWTSNPDYQSKQAFVLAKVFTEALIEQRTSWKSVLQTSLNPRCRGALTAVLANEDFPMKSQMIAILAKSETRLVYEMALSCQKNLPEMALLDFARMATIGGDIPLALEILTQGLEKAPAPEMARAIAFLEAGSGLDPSVYDGKWAETLELFRARAQRDFEKVLQLSSTLKGRPHLAYESRLLANSLTLENTGEINGFSAETSLAAIHRSFASPPGEPDIEALTSAVLIDWLELVRTLTLLAHPIEASERLSSEGQVTTAIGLLWRTGHREEARDLGEKALGGIDGEDHAKIRLTLASLHLEGGELKKAAEYFAPVIALGVSRENRRQAAISLGLRIFPRGKLIPLAPDLLADQAFQRASAISAFLPFPPKVAVYWYEYFREKDSLQAPEAIFKQVENFLGGDQKEARELIAAEISKSTKSRLLPSDVLYQLAFFLRTPTAVEIIEKAAWYQLSTTDLLTIVRDEGWPIESRKEALSSALAIDPANPAIQWLDRKLNGTAYPNALALHTLGDPSETLQLAALTLKRETLALTCELANIKDHRALRCLAILGKSYLENNQPAEAARLLQTMLCGEIAVGNHPATPIQATTENLANYFRSRKRLSVAEKEKAIWSERLKLIGQD